MDGLTLSAPPSFPDAGLFRDRAEESHTLPASWYTDPALPAHERDRIFFRNWWYFCALSELDAPGNYVAGSVLDQEVFVIRGRDGTLRAFYNVCSHRAHPLLEGHGKKHAIVCPYHQWRYGLDGGFERARGRESPSAEECAADGLKPVRVDVLGPMVFVNLSGDARPLAEAAGLFAGDLHTTCPRADALVLAERFSREVAANWKTVIDNNHECYHCDANHVSLTQQIDFRGTYVWSDFDQGFCHKVKLGGEDRAAYAIQGEGERQDGLFAFLWPNLIPLLWPGSPNIFAFQVIPTGPETCIERWDIYLSTPEPTADERSLIDYVRSTLIPEDVGLCENVQRGLRSRGYTQGRFVVDRAHTNISEHHVHLFQKLVRDALIGP